MRKRKLQPILDKINGRPLDQYPHDWLLWFALGCLLMVLALSLLPK